MKLYWEVNHTVGINNTHTLGVVNDLAHIAKIFSMKYDCVIYPTIRGKIRHPKNLFQFLKTSTKSLGSMETAYRLLKNAYIYIHIPYIS